MEPCAFSVAATAADMGKKVYLLSNFHKGSYEQISGKHAF